MKGGEVLDILTPIVLIPRYWLLYQLGLKNRPALREGLLFMLFVGLWVEGQGMHLSANSIGNLLKDMPEGDVYILTHFYDEVLSHYLWHLGFVGLSGLLLIRQWQNPFATVVSSLAPETISAAEALIWLTSTTRSPLTYPPDRVALMD